jgi:hypothetical protein
MNKLFEVGDSVMKIIKEVPGTNDVLSFQLQKYYPLVSLKLITQRREIIQTRIKQNFSLGIEQGFYSENFNAEILAVY